MLMGLYLLGLYVFTCITLQYSENAMLRRSFTKQNCNNILGLIEKKVIQVYKSNTQKYKFLGRSIKQIILHLVMCFNDKTSCSMDIL